MKPSRQPATLSKFMLLVALFALGVRLLTTPVASLGVAMLIIVPGSVIDRILGGTGVLGGLLSGCLILLAFVGIPQVLQSLRNALAVNPLGIVLPVVGLFLAIRLIWSGSPFNLFCIPNRGLDGRDLGNDPEAGEDDPESR